MPVPADLADEGNRLEARWRQLADDTRAPAFKALVDELQAWLQRCVARGRYLPPGHPERRSLQGQLDYWTSLLRQTGHDAGDIDRIAPFDPEAGQVLPDALFPYHGLQAVTPQDGAPFYGREEQTREYADHLDGHAALLIQSESGGGKSSVAMAGVLPELQRRHPEWPVVPRVTPGTQPADALRQALAARLQLPAGEVDAAAVQAALAGRTLLVYVDQLEELLTMCTDARQQREFSALLAALAEAGVMRLLATMRVDHYERLAHSADCNPLFTLLTRDGSVKTLPPMTLAQIRSVIQKPADAVGLRFVPASIVEMLASETANAPSGLPLLQFALQRLWDERPRANGQPLDLVTLATVAALPTVSTALGTVAERFYAEMEREGLVAACRRLMLELTVIDERLEVPLRRRRAEQEVLNVLAAAQLASPAQAQGLVDGLVQRRLLVRTGSGSNRQIEVAHEALFRYWSRFQEWFSSEATNRTLRETRRIAHDAVLWEQGGRAADLLNLRGERLKRAGELRDQHWLEPLAVAYVQACEQAERESTERRLRAEQAEAQALQARQQRSRAFAWSLGGVLVAAGIATAVVWQAQREQEQAERERARLETESLTSTALLAPLLKPMDALDLVYTLVQTQGGSATQVLFAQTFADIFTDGGENAKGSAWLAGARKQGPAQFTPSGQAMVQQFDQQGTATLAVRPFLPDGGGMAQAVTLPAPGLAAAGPETGWAVDVGPPMRSAEGARLLVVAGAAMPGDGAAGPAGLARPSVLRLPPAGGKAEPLAELLPAASGPAARALSGIAFDASGTRVAAVATLDEAAPSTRVLRWTLGQASATLEPPTSGPDRPTALAWAPDGSGTLMLGRANGRVDCSPTLPGGQAPAAVAALHGAADRASGQWWWAARLADQRVVAGLCGKAGQPPWELAAAGSTAPRQLALRAVPGEAGRPGQVELSFTREGRVVCLRLAASGPTGQTCMGHGLLVDRAVPALDPQGQPMGYWLLDGAEPLLTFWYPGQVAQSGWEEPAGLPWARPARWNGQRVVASSPDKRHRLALARVGEGPALELHWLAADGSPARTARMPEVEALAVTNQGQALVLARAAPAPNAPTGAAGTLTLWSPQGAPLPGAQAVDAAGCLALSRDGQVALVVSSAGRAALFTVGADGLQALAPPWQLVPADGRNDPVTACAVAGSAPATVVAGTASGRVLEGQPGGKDGPRSLAELARFRLDAPVLDVALDESARFATVVSARLAGRCRYGQDGHLLQVWDLRQRDARLPVYSACMRRDVAAIGPMTLHRTGEDITWLQPVHVWVNDGTARALRTVEVSCIACGDASGAVGWQALAEGELQSKSLCPATVQQRYGIQLPRPQTAEKARKAKAGTAEQECA